MKREDRVWWTERGYKDPFAAFMEHQRGAEQRGIDFRLSFEQWWTLWEPHYANRGTRAGQMCMCRTRDEGAYEVGNVRIDQIKGNIAEAAVQKKTKKASSAYLPSRDRYRPTPAGNGHWMWRNPFAEYSEESLDKEK